MTDKRSEPTEADKISRVASEHFEAVIRPALAPGMASIVHLGQPLQLIDLTGTGSPIWTVQLLALGREIGSIVVSGTFEIIRFGVRVHDACEIERLPLATTELDAEVVKQKIADETAGESSDCPPTIGYAGFTSKIAWAQELTNGRRAFVTPEFSWVENTTN